VYLAWFRLFIHYGREIQNIHRKDAEDAKDKKVRNNAENMLLRSVENHCQGAALANDHASG
jgi:hypothetical protein